MPKPKQHPNLAAHSALTAYIEANNSSNLELTENVIDLLSDLRHLADAKCIDFKECLLLSGAHYKAETGGDDYDSLTDRATYAVELWMNNDEPTYSHWTARAKSIHANASQIEQVKSGIWTIAAAIRYQLADEMEEELREASPLKNSSVYSDLLGTAFGEVSWVSIADTFADELEE